MPIEPSSPLFSRPLAPLAAGPMASPQASAAGGAVGYEPDGLSLTGRVEEQPFIVTQLECAEASRRKRTLLGGVMGAVGLGGMAVGAAALGVLSPLAVAGVIGLGLTAVLAGGYQVYQGWQEVGSARRQLTGEGT